MQPSCSPNIYQNGDLVPFHLSPGIVAASYFVSLTGAVTTVELLHQSSKHAGWIYWLHIFAGSSTMGLVATWCMHYVGNRAITLGNGCDELQLAYSTVYTVLSSLIPLLVLSGAFALSKIRYKGRQARLLSLFASGLVAGMAIVGMHYVGNLGVSNYHVSFTPSRVGGAVAIACTVSTATIFLIFKLQDFWWNTFAWRVACAVCLAGGVSGMHFEASMGTTYRLKHKDANLTRLRNTSVIVATILSLLMLPICVCIGWYSSRRTKEVGNRAQEVVLALARYDHEGRFMVTSDGTLPCRRITSQQNQRSFEDEFDVGHPAFQWIYRASHRWEDISKWVPSMRDHLQSLINANEKPEDFQQKNEPTIPWQIGDDPGYSRIFREHFCVTASDLAGDIKEPLNQLGTLYESVVMTGTLDKLGRGKNLSLLRCLRSHNTSVADDVEDGNGHEMFGKGQVLFLVRRTERKDLPRVQSLGFRFIPPQKIGNRLAQQMQVPQTYLNEHLARLRTKCSQNHKKIQSGTLLACFALRAGIGRRNWEVVSLRDQRDQLPAVPLWSVSPDQERKTFLTQLDGLNVKGCLALLARRIGCLNEQENAYCHSVKRAILDLMTLIAEPFFMHAIFSCKVLRFPVRNYDGARVYRSLLAFHIVPDVHNALLKSSQKLDYIPFTFFRCLQHVSDDAQGGVNFKSQLHQEFANILEGHEEDVDTHFQHSSIQSSNNLSKLSNYLPRRKKLKSSSEASIHSLGDVSASNSTQQSLNSTLEDNMSGTGTRDCTRLPFGGIMVSSDIVVEKAYKEDTLQKHSMAAKEIQTGTRAEACAAAPDVPSFADELFAMTVSRWLRV